LITPAGRAGVYTLKITPGAANADGICKITVAWNTIGAFAKTVHEVAVVTGLLLQRGKAATADNTLANHLRKDFTGLRIGFVDPDLWAIEDDAKEADPSFPGEIVSDFLQI
jgi:amidase